MNDKDEVNVARRSSNGFQFSLAGMFFLVTCFGVLFASWHWIIEPARARARRMECVNNLKQIGVALLNYHDLHSTFPPAYIVDANGTPAHSWRVLIWHCLESGGPRLQYNFAEPWNGPNNRLLTHRPYCFACPDCPDASKTNCTNYVMIVGPAAMSDGSSSTTLNKFIDGTSNTIIVVEIHHSNIHWMEPRDLSTNEMSFQVNDRTKPSISSNHVGGAMVVRADGSVQFLPNSISADELKALLTIAGGEIVEIK